MTYDEAMALLALHPAKHIVKRPAFRGTGVAIRFGRIQRVHGPRHMADYEPTREDVTATDWEKVR